MDSGALCRKINFHISPESSA